MLRLYVAAHDIKLLLQQLLRMKLLISEQSVLRYFLLHRISSLVRSLMNSATQESSLDETLKSSAYEKFISSRGGRSNGAILRSAAANGERDSR